MAFNVDFYSFSKRKNSTALPGAPSASYPCRLKSECGIIAPTIVLDLGLNNAPTFNYCHIAAFGDRYYFVTEWTWVSNRLWAASLSEDVLATFRWSIGEASLYVLRSAAASNGNVVDNLYPTTANQSYAVCEANEYPWRPNEEDPTVFLTDGVFILGVTGSTDGVTLGAISYYALSYGAMTTFINFLLTTAGTFTIEGVSDATTKSLIDPFQYIKSCIWIPLKYSDIPGSAKSALSYYTFSVPNCNCKFLNGATGNYFIQHVTFTNLPKHPQLGTHGAYTMLAPYSQYVLYFLPFGSLPLDSLMYANASSIDCKITVDELSGKAKLELEYINNDGSTCIGLLTYAQVGIQIQLSQVTIDTIRTAGNVLGTIGDVFTGNFMGIANGIGDAAKSMQPQEKSIGQNNGSLIDLEGKAKIYCQFTEITDQNVPEKGKPLMAIRKINTLPGYILCQEGDVAINGTGREQEEIKSYLETGFFYE